MFYASFAHDLVYQVYQMKGIRLSDTEEEYLRKLPFLTDLYIDLLKGPPNGLDFIKKTNYDLIITDLMMPGVTGAEIVSKILDFEPQIKIIVITGNATPQIHKDSTHAGASRFVPKPFTPFQWCPMDDRKSLQSKFKTITQNTVFHFGLQTFAIFQKVVSV